MKKKDNGRNRPFSCDSFLERWTLTREMGKRLNISCPTISFLLSPPSVSFSSSTWERLLTETFHFPAPLYHDDLLQTKREKRAQNWLLAGNDLHTYTSTCSLHHFHQTPISVPCTFSSFNKLRNGSKESIHDRNSETPVHNGGNPTKRDNKTQRSHLDRTKKKLGNSHQPESFHFQCLKSYAGKVIR